MEWGTPFQNSLQLTLSVKTTLTPNLGRALPSASVYQEGAEAGQEEMP